MLNPDLRVLLKGHTSKYSLVRAVAKRARELTEDEELAGKCADKKPVTCALEEFLSGELEIVEPEEIKEIRFDC